MKYILFEGGIYVLNYHSNYLFSETYIQEKVAQINQNNEVSEDIIRIFEATKEWFEPFNTGEISDDYWIDDFIDIILNSILDFFTVRKGRVRVLKENDIVDPSVVAYVLKKNENINSKTKGKFYAYNIIQAAKNENVDWCILTDGYKWRLYNTDTISPYEQYLEIDIEESLKKNKADSNFILYANFFNKNNFTFNKDNNLRIDKMLEESNKKISQIEDYLKEKAELILNDLCNGFKENMNFDNYTEEDRRNIYVDSITYLYRLLFFGYSEARGLLPSNPGDDEYNKNSFQVICKEAKELLNKPGGASEIADEFGFWDRIDEYLRIHVDENYDGGLFENKDKPILKNYKIKNRYLMKAIAEINYFEDKHEEVYTEKINYKDLSVRNLGAIYEGLLEYNLFIAQERLVKRKSRNKIKFVKASETKVKKSDIRIEEGQVYISEDPTERKETGSYYTPEKVVEYIVSNTVEDKINNLKKELEEQIKKDLKNIEIEVNENIKKGIQYKVDEKIIKFIENEILDLNIIDSAMGSGHFLVNAAYKLTNKIIEIISKYDWVNDDVILNINYWRRKVVENCLYGIDINELAVYLSRLSLWLISATNDRPLSFIDHHLKVGNSIVGAKRKDISFMLDEDKSTLFDVDEENKWKNKIMPMYKKLNSLEAATMEGVKKQKKIYQRIKKEVKLSKKKYDYYLAKQLKDSEISDEFNEIMLTDDIERFKQNDLKSLMRYAKENKFFHWELEFPEVFNNGGFDIAIGNPPYFNVRSNNIIYKTDIYKEISTRVTNSANIFLCHMFKYLKNNNGILGFIIPKSFGHVKSWRKGRRFILNQKKVLHINDVGQAFEEVGLEAMILIVLNRRSLNEEVNVYNHYELINKIDQKYFVDNDIIVSSLDSRKFKLVNKMKINSIELGNIANMPRGKYIKRSRCIDKPKEGYLRFLGGTNISKYKIKDGGKRKRNKYIKQDDPKLSSKQKYFIPNRIIYQNIMSSSPKFVACLEKEGLPTDDTVNNLILNTNEYKYKYVLAIMNSKLSSFYLKYYITNCSKLTVHLDKPYAGKCLILNADKDAQQEFCDLVNKIDSSEDKQTINKIKSKIDNKVYKLFNLEEDEIDLIESSLNKE